MSDSHTPTPLEIVGLKKHYGSVKAVDGVDLDVNAGELVGFIGPNGAGKSTTFRSIVGLQSPTAGTVRVCGVDVNADRMGALAKLGYVGQEGVLYQYLTGEELLRMVGRLHGLDDALVEERLAHLLPMLDLEAASKRLVHEYSGGMSRKLAIAAAVIHEPPLILLDESFRGLDPEATAAIRDHLDALRERGSAVLLSSHVLDMLERWVSRVVIIDGGKVVDDMSRAALDDRLADTTLVDLYLTRVRH